MVSLTHKLCLIGLALALLLLLLVPLHPLLHEGVWRELGNVLHFPLMAAFTLLIFFALATSTRPGRYGSAAWAGCGTALVTEVLQPWVGRTASTMDFVLGALGVAVALGGLYAWRDGGLPLRLLHGFVTLGLFVPLFHPTWLELRATAWRSNRFPVLGDFEEEIELRLWQDRNSSDEPTTTLKLVNEHASTGSRSLAVHTEEGAWPGVVFYAGGADWRDYERLMWDVYNPSGPFNLSLRVDDERLARFELSFHSKFTAEPGWNHFTIPLERIRRGSRIRELDLSHVRRVYFYAEGDRSRLFFLDHVRLAGAG